MRKSIPAIRARKGGEPISMLTAYTAPMARLLDPHVDMLLVGDSVGMVIHGLESTVSVTLDMMVLHTEAVKRGSTTAAIVADLPFGSYQGSPADAFAASARLLVAGAQAVKLEGGAEMAETVAFLTRRGIPVMGHVGLLPQSVNTLGGYGARGHEPVEADAILEAAHRMTEAGAFALLIEGTLEPLARRITQEIAIPTIGIGASAECDGQVLVTDDMLGLTGQRTPRFVRHYADLATTIGEAAVGVHGRCSCPPLPRAGTCLPAEDAQGVIVAAKSPAGVRIDTARSVPALRAAVAQWRRAGERVGLVPTMGALHDGHLALVRAAREAGADRVAVSIFVNPKQFNAADDLARYPREEAADLARLEAAGADLAYLPTAADIYPPGFCTTVSLAGPVVRDLEAAWRPGHFDGVATVVTKLLLQAAPDVAAFGEKDFQQLLLVQTLARDLDISCRIVPVPTIRDAQGLALSSRNARLTPGQMAVARQLNRILLRVAAGDLKPDRAEVLLGEAGFDAVEYLVIRDARTLAEPAGGQPRRVLAAVRLGDVRLIDNVPMNG